MPPSIILEVLKITEAEMELRDQTRETEQAREALSEDGELEDRTDMLAEEQEDIAWRLGEVTQEVMDLPNGEKEFEAELKILRGARSAMQEALAMLEETHTGSATIAAETEAIELLLRARRAGGGGGGGGGSTPGAGGGSGVGSTPALALAGRSIGAGEEIEERDVDRSQAAIVSKVPAELQEALDRYFDALEGR